MRTSLCLVPVLLLAACGGHAAAPATPAALTLPDSTVVLDGASGAPLSNAELLRRIGAADFVLLGEYHDNARDHQARGTLITTATRHPGLVFEQFARTGAPIPLPAAGEDPFAQVACGQRSGDGFHGGQRLGDCLGGSEQDWGLGTSLHLLTSF